MKAVILIFTVFVLTISFNGYSLESSLTNDSVELIVDTNSESIVIDSSSNDLIESTEETPSKPAGYGQLFMFGFLILGALFVVWKFKEKA